MSMNSTTTFHGPYTPGSFMADQFHRYFSILTDVLLDLMQRKCPERNFNRRDVWPTIIRYYRNGMHGVGLGCHGDEPDMGPDQWNLSNSQIELTDLISKLKHLAEDEFPLIMTLTEIRRLIDLCTNGGITINVSGR